MTTFTTPSPHKMIHRRLPKLSMLRTYYTDLLYRTLIDYTGIIIFIPMYLSGFVYKFTKSPFVHIDPYYGFKL